MRSIRGGDENSIDAFIVDELHWVIKYNRIIALRGSLSGMALIKVIDSSHLCTANKTMQIDGVARAHTTRANDTD
jgi:hypothetical protein